MGAGTSSNGCTYRIAAIDYGLKDHYAMQDAKANRYTYDPENPGGQEIVVSD